MALSLIWLAETPNVWRCEAITLVQSPPPGHVPSSYAHSVPPVLVR